MRTAFRLPSVLKGLKSADERFSEPALDQAKRCCVEMIGLNFSVEKETDYDHSALIKFIDIWSTDERIAYSRDQSGDFFVKELYQLSRVAALAIKDVEDFDRVVPEQVNALQRQLAQMQTINQQEISDLVAESAGKMKQMQINTGAYEAGLQLMTEELTGQLEECKKAYESELRENAAEIIKLGRLLQAAFDEFDRRVAPTYHELLVAKDKVAQQQLINDQLDEAFAEQDVEYRRVVAEEERILNEKLLVFRENRAAKIIQRAYREFKLKQRKQLRKAKKRGGKKRK